MAAWISSSIIIIITIGSFSNGVSVTQRTGSTNCSWSIQRHDASMAPWNRYDASADLSPFDFGVFLVKDCSQSRLGTMGEKSTS